MVARQVLHRRADRRLIVSRVYKWGCQGAAEGSGAGIIGHGSPGDGGVRRPNSVFQAGMYEYNFFCQ